MICPLSALFLFVYVSLTQSQECVPDKVMFDKVWHYLDYYLPAAQPSGQWSLLFFPFSSSFCQSSIPGGTSQNNLQQPLLSPYLWPFSTILIPFPYAVWTLGASGLWGHFTLVLLSPAQLYVPVWPGNCPRGGLQGLQNAQARQGFGQVVVRGKFSHRD